MLPQIQGDHQSQLLFQGSGYEQQSWKPLGLPKSPVEVRRIISIRSMLVYLLRAVFIVQWLWCGCWESGSLGQSCLAMRILGSSGSAALQGVLSQGLHPKPCAMNQEGGFRQTPFEPWPGQGQEWGMVFSSSSRKQTFSFPILLNVGSFSPPCAFLQGGRLILFAPCSRDTERDCRVLGQTPDPGFIPLPKQTQTGMGRENLSPRGRTLHLIISTLTDVVFQFVEHEVGQDFSLSPASARLFPVMRIHQTPF